MNKEIINRIEIVERKIFLMEKILWYCAGTLTIKLGSEAIPFVSALLK